MITFKEEFIGCPKWVRAIKLAGSDAIVMWLALKLYAATHPTNGFIPDEEVESLRGAPRNPRKALKALVDCGSLDADGERGSGLIDRAVIGWQMHDYTEHANSSEHELLRRERARDRKRQQRERERLELEALLAATGEPRRLPAAGDTGGVTSRGTEAESQRDKRDSHSVTSVTVTAVTEPVTSGARPPAPVRVPVPNPTQPSQQENNPPPKDLSGSARERPALVVVKQEDQKIPCPADLQLPQAQRDQLEASIGINAYQLDQITVRFRTSFGTDQSDTRTLVHWLKCLSKAICSDFSNPRTRPPRSAEEPETARETQSRLKNGHRQPTASDHSDPDAHFGTIGAREI